MQAGLAVLAGCAVGVGETGMGAGLLVAVSGLDGQGERGGVLRAGLPGLSRGAQDLVDAVERLCLAVAVAGLTEEPERLQQMVSRARRQSGAFARWAGPAPSRSV